MLERIQPMQSLLERLLLEKIPLGGIARVLKVSERWLQRYVNQKYQDISQEVQVQPKPKCRLTIQMDELWSFVGNTDNQLWVWLGLDVETRENEANNSSLRRRCSAYRRRQNLYTKNKEGLQRTVTLQRLVHN